MVKPNPACMILVLLVWWLAGCIAPLSERKPYGTVILYAVPSAGGTVVGGGSYPAQTTIQISASPNSGWAFNQWNDGVQDAVRFIRVPNPNSSVTYTASFVQTAPTPISIIVGWTAEPTAVSYRVYQGPSHGNYTNWTGATGTQATLVVQPKSVNYIAATSVAVDGLESTNYSNEIAYTAP
jgi:hypothetical protein